MATTASAPPSVIASVAYSNGRRIGEVALDDISDVIERPDTFVWIGLYEPNEPLLRKTQEEFGLHDLAIEDALTAHQRPKVERYDNSLFVVMRTAQIEDPKPNKPCDVRYGEVHIFLGRNFIVTVRHGYATSFSQVRTRAESTPDLLKQGPAFVLYAIIDFIVDQYFPIVDALGEELESLEQRVFTQPFSRKTTTQIYKLKRDLIALKRVVAPVIELSARLIRLDDEDLIPTQARPYFRDVYDPASGRMGSHFRRPYRDRGHLRHELRPDAGTAVAPRVSARPRPDRRPLRDAVRQVQKGQMALTT
jgi:magnesium transporter